MSYINSKLEGWNSGQMSHTIPIRNASLVMCMEAVQAFVCVCDPEPSVKSDAKEHCRSLSARQLIKSSDSWSN